MVYLIELSPHPCTFSLQYLITWQTATFSLLLFAWLCIQVLDFIEYFALIFKVFWISVSVKYKYNISIIWIQLKISEQMSKSGCFQSQSHISQDSGFSTKIMRIQTGFKSLLPFPVLVPIWSATSSLKWQTNYVLLVIKV